MVPARCGRTYSGRAHSLRDSDSMSTERLNAFSDGVIAIIITILVLELKAPHGTDFGALSRLVPIFLTYVLSFIVIAIYWNNHHHMFHLTDRITGGILWANLHLLFWLSLMPFATGWMGENHFAPLPTALYGTVLLFAGIAYFVLEQTIIRSSKQRSVTTRKERSRYCFTQSPSRSLSCKSTCLMRSTPWWR